ncbi:MAG: ATPase, T2SS/T4P/T4SS family [Planctomycetota bacterium]|nr:ATPase, T2SS/T4P/T4SS family [Planctomycetota bacterium]
MNQAHSKLTSETNGHAVHLADSIEVSDGLDAKDSSKTTTSNSMELDGESVNLKFLDDLSGLTPAKEFLTRIPISYARHWNLLGCHNAQREPCIVLNDPSSIDQFDVVQRYLGWNAFPVLTASNTLQESINAAYESNADQSVFIIEEADVDAEAIEFDQPSGPEDLLDSASRSPVIQLVNQLLFEAIKLRASDLHIQPFEHTLMARLRIDGILFDHKQLQKHHQEEIVSRIKIIGSMNIAEKRLPQDGRATVHVGDRVIDLRLSSVPTSHGERLVIRLLDKSARLYRLSEIGLLSGNLDRFQDLIRVEHGLLLVTGPTGSGKSTTLYAALQEINSSERNVITLEDPIEYQLPGVSQIQVSAKKGMTFASGLRSVLRQDPDIIMIGEIRDEETAVMAIQSALTGHLVFSTLHTNDAASSITRLLDLGIEPYLAASSLIGVLAQRLVRRICSECSQPHTLNEEEVKWLGLDQSLTSSSSPFRGGGCEHCRDTGYRGRLGLFELLAMNEGIRHLVMTRATAAQIKQEAIRDGMTTLQASGSQQVLNGSTTSEEVFRVTMRATV